MFFFRIVWSLAIVLLAIAVTFFAIGIGDESVSEDNLLLWLGLLAALAAIVVGGRLLAGRRHLGLATALVLLPVIPAVLYGIVILVGMMTGARWN